MGRVRREHDPQLRKIYPYYCPRCNENMYSYKCVDIPHGRVVGKAAGWMRRKIETVIPQDGYKHRLYVDKKQ